MTLEAGRSLAHYRLAERIGEGAMGEVWKATDSTLGREVAIKILPAEFAADAERIGRFEREAKVLASLNHPGIAAIYGFHESNGVRFLAMELVPGEDLAQRLEKGSVPASEATDIARQIAESLEAAHDQGIVHRDLKPANVKLTPDGKVKVLDFGLAKALDPMTSGGRSGVDSRFSPTVTSLGTVAGVILGTAAYMSPEQAKGKAVDRRTDIWAFGCILYEMLVGRRPFDGEGISEVLAAVIMAPIAFDALPPSIPSRLRALVERCMERDPRRRLRDIGEARLALEDIQSGRGDERTSQPATPPAAVTPSAVLLAGAIVGTAAVTALIAYGLHRAAAPAAAVPPVRRFEIAAQGSFRSVNQSRLLAISPDGKSVAYFEAGRLFVRALSRIEPTVVPTKGEPTVLFWSPDNQDLGYAAGGKLWKVPAAGGESSLIADIRMQLTGGSSASWCPDGKIVFTSGDGGVMRVSSTGGDFEELVPIEKGAENDIHDASCLEDNSVLFVPHSVAARPHSLWIFANGKRKLLVKLADDQDIWFPVYSRAGFILYHRHPANAGVWAVPFSLAKHEITGDPFLLANDGDVPSVSADGTLVYSRGSGSRLSHMVWVDRSGKAVKTIGTPQEQWPFPELSPDGRFVAIAARETELSDVWIHDIERGSKTRLSGRQPGYSFEAWSPDGRKLVYSEGLTPPVALKSKLVDGSGDATSLGNGWAPAYSADGRYLLSADLNQDGDWDLWYRDLRTGGAPVALVKGKPEEIAPRISPDGKYFAYVSDESGPDEVYLKRFPAGEGRWQVSTQGGYWPRFSRRGDKIYYVIGDTIMEVDVSLGSEPKLGVPRALFARKPLGWGLVFGWPAGFDVSPDGSRFVVVEPQTDARQLGGIVVEENWERAK